MISPRRLAVIGAPGSLAAAIGAALIATEAYAPAADGPVEAVLLDGSDAATETPFLDLDDAVFATQAIHATLDRIAALQGVLPRLAAGGSIVVIGTDAHLGRWHATGQAAASAALVGVMRSVAMEYGRHGLRTNLIALPLEATAANTALMSDAARQAAAMLDAVSINGETVLLDGGGNLKMRQAKRR